MSSFGSSRDLSCVIMEEETVVSDAALNRHSRDGFGMMKDKWGERQTRQGRQAVWQDSSSFLESFRK